MSDLTHTEEIRQVLEEHGLIIEDIDLYDMDTPSLTRISIDGRLDPARQKGGSHD